MTPKCLRSARPCREIEYRYERALELWLREAETWQEGYVMRKPKPRLSAVFRFVDTLEEPTQ